MRVRRGYARGMQKLRSIVCALLIAVTLGEFVASSSAIAIGIGHRPIAVNRKVVIGPEVLYAVRVDPDVGVDPVEARRSNGSPVRDSTPLSGGLWPALDARPTAPRRFCL